MGWEAATLVGGFRSGEAFPKNPKRVYFAKVPFPSALDIVNHPGVVGCRLDDLVKNNNSS